MLRVRVQLGPYALEPQNFRTLAAIVTDRLRVARRGIPRLPGDTPAELAAASIRANAGEILRAGGGHFHAMWTADTGKAFAGAMTVLDRDYLTALVERMIVDSHALGHVPTCFTEHKVHDVPWRRGDNAPWLFHMVALLDDRDLAARREKELFDLYVRWATYHLSEETGLVRRRVRGDWMDTVPRPSSTYNNLCALRAHQAAAKLNIPGAADSLQRGEQELVATRWTGSHLSEHAGADTELTADANVPALYFGVLPAWARRDIAKTLEESPLVRPYAMRTREGKGDSKGLPFPASMVPLYHATVWTHLGFMLANGLKREGRPWRPLAQPLEEVMMKHGTFLETLDADGKPHMSPWLATEYHFTMSAGLYLELFA